MGHAMDDYHHNLDAAGSQRDNVLSFFAHNGAKRTVDLADNENRLPTCLEDGMPSIRHAKSEPDLAIDSVAMDMQELTELNLRLCRLARDIGCCADRESLSVSSAPVSGILEAAGALIAFLNRKCLGASQNISSSSSNNSDGLGINTVHHSSSILLMVLSCHQTLLQAFMNICLSICPFSDCSPLMPPQSNLGLEMEWKSLSHNDTKSRRQVQCQTGRGLTPSSCNQARMLVKLISHLIRRLNKCLKGLVVTMNSTISSNSYLQASDLTTLSEESGSSSSESSNEPSPPLGLGAMNGSDGVSAASMTARGGGSGEQHWTKDRAELRNTSIQLGQVAIQMMEQHQLNVRANVLRVKQVVKAYEEADLWK